MYRNRLLTMIARIPFCLRLIFAAFIVFAIFAPGVIAEPFTLQAVRAQVKTKYDSVAQLPTARLSELLADRDKILLLDVREPDEYAVSRIPGAIRVDPGTWRWSFLQSFAAQARGKKVIFYCSVGVRSSRLAEAVQDGLKSQGALGVYNLDGGIFAWHNEDRTLANRKGPTRFVHPFDTHWGQLVDRKDLLRRKPAH